MTEYNKKALVIVNPTAGKKAVQSNMFNIIDPLCRVGYMPTVITTSASGDATVYAHEMSADYDIVVCCGGDGTLNETITGMMSSGTIKPIGYIPCGTTNDMAKSLGLPKTIKAAAEMIAEGNRDFHDVGRFGEGMYFSYIASFGAFTKVSYTTPQATKNLLGHFAYVLEGAKELGKLRSYHVKLTFDDQVIEDDFIYVSITNTTSFAGLFSFPKNTVTLNDGLFELLLIKNPKNPIETSSILLNLSKKDFTSDKNMILAHTSHIKIETEEPIVWTIDGECSGEVTNIEIHNIPDTISICMPKYDE